MATCDAKIAALERESVLLDELFSALLGGVADGADVGRRGNE